MNILLSITHFAAAGVGALLALFLIPKSKSGVTEMNKFESILKDVGKGLLFVFTNKTAKSIESGGLNLASLIWPGLSPLFAGLSRAIANAQAQAQVSTTGLSESEIIALICQDAQADFQTAGITETARQQAIVAAAIALIDEIPSGSVNAAVVGTAVAQAAAAPAAPASAAAPAAPAAPVAQAQPGPGLSTVVPD
jgi:hypothetical protein